MTRKFLASLVRALSLPSPIALNAQTAESKLTALEKSRRRNADNVCMKPPRAKANLRQHGRVGDEAAHRWFHEALPGNEGRQRPFSGAAIITRLDVEARAGKPVADVVLSGQLGVLALIEKKIAMRYLPKENFFATV